MPDCLIIDDEPSIAQTVSEYFNIFDVTCEYATSYDDGIKAIYEKRPSLVLLDVNLGGESGFALCKKIRENSHVPVIFISVRNTDDDILAALGTGGDDFITKPFSMAVLLAKVKAMLKRSGVPAAAVAGGAGEVHTTDAATVAGGAGEVHTTDAATVAIGATEAYTAASAQPASAAFAAADGYSVHAVSQQAAPAFGGVTIDRNTNRVSKGGESIKLKPMEWKLLLYMIDNQNRIVTKDELLENVWQDTFIGEGTLSVHIRHLREKLEDSPNDPKYIKTVWGSGYLFESDR